MRWFDFLLDLLPGKGRGRGVEELARRLGLSLNEVRSIRPAYREFSVPKRSGGRRRILAPEPALKSLQRRVLRRLLGRLTSHPAATGFERFHSIVTNARCHVGQAVVVRMDLKDFFESTPAGRVRRYFRAVGWNREATALIVAWCTHRGGLPQGAPTSPRLSNLVNRLLDARLEGLAKSLGGAYTRYADDITFSFSKDDAEAVRAVIRFTGRIAADEGYALHLRRKLHVRRRHDRQVVTGLVVNEGVRLPREVRRRLRAVDHRAALGQPTSMTPAQRAGWRALEAMVAKQGGA